LLLVGISLYGVLNYFVVQCEREIGIRIAIGAQVADIARGVTRNVFYGLRGIAVGVALGMILAHYAETLLYEVKSTNPIMLGHSWVDDPARQPAGCGAGGRPWLAH
jgi:ABC-type lipoprotein release transport system permease subunit